MTDFNSKEYQENHRNEDEFPVTILARIFATSNSKEGAEDLVRNQEVDFNDLIDLKAGNNPLLGINYPLLKKQKKSLNVFLDHADLDSDLSNHLIGIRFLIDSIQDYAVDVLGHNKNIVFDLKDE